MQSTAATSASATQADNDTPPPPTHLTPLPLGQLRSSPWSFHPAWFLLLAFGVPASTWLGLAWKRALDEDPHRLRRAGLRELRKLLARVGRSNTAPQPLHLHGWCQAAARTWGVRVSTPTGRQVTQSLHTLTDGDGATATAWRELWSVTERGLYGAEAAAPADWLQRASTAAGQVQLPKRERWLPDRVAHWLPAKSAAAVFLVGLALCARADQAPAPMPQNVQKAAAGALHTHWNDWAAHYNITTAMIQEGNWNYAVAHAATAFLLEPSSTANRDNLRFAIQQAGSMDPTLRRLLYGPWFQQFPALLSPAAWQHLALIASLILAAGLTALVLTLYLPTNRRPLRLAGRGALIAGGVLIVVAIGSFNSYGLLARATAGILVEGVNLNPSPTELVPEQETSPAAAGSVVSPQRSFLSWRQVGLEANASGWVRENAVMPFYPASRH